MPCDCDSFSEHDRYSPHCPYKDECRKITTMMCQMGRTLNSLGVLKDVMNKVDLSTHQWMIQHAMLDRDRGEPWTEEDKQALKEADKNIARLDERIKRK